MKIIPSLLLFCLPMVPLFAGSVPDIDRQPHPDLEVATFGLG